VSDPGPLHADLKARFGDKVLAGWRDEPFEVILLEKGEILPVARHLVERGLVNALMDLTAVDYLGVSGARPSGAGRFELVYYFLSFPPGAGAGARLRVKLPVPERDPTVLSLTPLFGSADWLEREVWDMFGIRFTGHPNLKRILMYDGFSGHPLRKDYPLKKQQPRVPQLFPGVPAFGARPKGVGG